jgi:FkbM family methyltransferase
MFMMRKLKEFVKGSLLALVNMSRKTRVGQYLHNQIVNIAMDQVVKVSHEELSFNFSAPNLVCHWRLKTFSTKEPETLEWIDSIPEGSVLWDVGANIGLYSVYAAKRKYCEVWAFEPSVFNLELLARNIFLNNLTNKVFIVPLALSDSLGASQLRMTSTEWGGACSTFGRDFSWDGLPIQQVFEFQTLGLSMWDAIQRLGIPQPDYIKMDVDGIEHLILKGGLRVLQSIKGILIEVNDGFLEQSEQCQSCLTQAGLVLKEKRQSNMFVNSAYKNSFNQIWGRP